VTGTSRAIKINPAPSAAVAMIVHATLAATSERGQAPGWTAPTTAPAPNEADHHAPTDPAKTRSPNPDIGFGSFRCVATSHAWSDERPTTLVAVPWQRPDEAEILNPDVFSDPSYTENGVGTAVWGRLTG
jgi:hypothetical protein